MEPRTITTGDLFARIGQLVVENEALRMENDELRQMLERETPEEEPS